MRRIILTGEIDADKYEAFSSKLSELEIASHKDLILELSSEGGDAHYALAISDRMRHSPCNIIVHAYGLVASAAVVILASGDTRCIAKEAWVMVHEDSVAELEGTGREIMKYGRHMMRLEDQWAAILAEKTTTPATKWAELHRDETYLDSEECLELGLVDKII